MQKDESAFDFRSPWQKWVYTYLIRHQNGSGRTVAPARMRVHLGPAFAVTSMLPTLGDVISDRRSSRL